MIEVAVDGVTFSTDATTGWTLATLEGWYSAPGVKTDTEERPNADGAFGVRRFYRGARIVTLTGLGDPGSRADAVVTMWPELAAIMTGGEPRTLTVTDDLGTLSALVAPVGTPSLVPDRDGLAHYVLQFVAYDPVKYGPARSVVTGLPSSGGGLVYALGEPDGALSYGALGNLGRVTLANAGTAEVWPRFEVAGGLTDGFYLQCLESGQVLRYERIVPDGSTVTLDSRTGEVLIDGVSDGSTYLTRDDWFSVAAGGSCTVQFNSIGATVGTPQLTVTISDGYW